MSSATVDPRNAAGWAAMTLVTIRDLQHRMRRVAIVVFCTAVVFSTLLLMAGIGERMRAEPRLLLEHLGTDWWLLPSDAGAPLTIGGTVETAAVDGYDNVEPIITTRQALLEGQDPREVLIVGSLPDGATSPKLTEGRQVERQGEAVVSDILELSPGDHLRLAGGLTVVGVLTDASILVGRPAVFVHFQDAQDHYFGGRSLATGFVGTGDPPASVPDGYQIVTNGKVADDSLLPLREAIDSVGMMEVILWVVAALIIGAVVYLSALERRRDFAVLKALGAADRALLAGLLMQAMLVAAVAYAASLIIQTLMVPLFPIPVKVPPAAYVRLPVLAVVVAAGATLAGIRPVKSTSPALAFSPQGA